MRRSRGAPKISEAQFSAGNLHNAGCPQGFWTASLASANADERYRRHRIVEQWSAGAVPYPRRRCKKSPSCSITTRGRSWNGRCSVSDRGRVSSGDARVGPRALQGDPAPAAEVRVRALRDAGAGARARAADRTRSGWPCAVARQSISSPARLGKGLARPRP
jgi:hypothetical protein